MLRLESPLYFGNVERFRNMLVTTSGLDPASAQQESRKLVSSDPQEKDELLSGRIRNEVSDINVNKPQGFYRRPITVFSLPFSLILKIQSLLTD